MENQRNIIMAVLFMAVILIGWDYGLKYVYPPQAKTEQTAATTAKLDESAVVTTSTSKTALRPVNAVLAQAGRVPIKAPRVSGSINLAGARLDDLVLLDHRTELAKTSPPVRLFAPADTGEQHFAQFGWIGEGVETPSSATIWTPKGSALTPTTPLELTWTNAAGQIFSITYAIDKNYLITATQGFANPTAQNVSVRPLALVNRTSKTAAKDTFNIHTGPIGVVDNAAFFDVDYKTLTEAGRNGTAYPANVGWLGFTDIYWLSALVPQGGKAEGNFRALGGDIFQTEIRYPPAIVGAGKQTTQKTLLFAGAKETNVLDAYEATGIPQFSLAIDWGWFRWFEKPIFYLLHWLFTQVGNFGVAIILLTIIIRGLMFPIAQKQFASMAQMRAIQPKMKQLQERHKDDKQKMQTEIMALYKKEKVNPLAGCLPMFLQIPVFFALYKVLLLTIEMRHQPFALWIKDLSAPDSLTPVNLFGLLPFTPPGFLAIGVLPIILGVTMWLQFRLNPAPMDPVQQKVFSFMPWMMMFVMAPFAAGLQLYWSVSNILTIAQQKWLYSKHPQLKEAMAKDEAAKASDSAKAKA